MDAIKRSEHNRHVWMASLAAVALYRIYPIHGIYLTRFDANCHTVRTADSTSCNSWRRIWPRRKCPVQSVRSIKVVSLSIAHSGVEWKQNGILSFSKQFYLLWSCCNTKTDNSHTCLGYLVSCVHLYQDAKIRGISCNHLLVVQCISVAMAKWENKQVDWNPLKLKELKRGKR